MTPRDESGYENKRCVRQASQYCLSRACFSWLLTCCTGSSCNAQVLAQEQQDSQLDADIAKLDVLRSLGNSALRVQIDLDSTKWQSRDRNAFLRYMYQACSELSSYDIGDISQRALLLGQYSISVLQSGDLPLPEYVQFVEFLGLDLPAISEGVWKELRRQKALLLETWRRMGRATDSNFDFNDRPLLNVRPRSRLFALRGFHPRA